MSSNTDPWVTPQNDSLHKLNILLILTKELFKQIKKN